MMDASRLKLVVEDKFFIYHDSDFGRRLVAVVWPIQGMETAAVARLFQASPDLLRAVRMLMKEKDGGVGHLTDAALEAQDVLDALEGKSDHG